MWWASGFWGGERGRGRWRVGCDWHWSLASSASRGERGEEEEGSRATGDLEQVVSACGGAGVRSWRFAAERQKNKHLSLV